MNRVLAISGGVDSMVMLDFLCRNYPEEQWKVVTINHGTRASAAEDAEFVRRVAQEKYGREAEIVDLRLGEGASEAEARTARYAALARIAGEDGTEQNRAAGEIWVAQHLDDLVESVAINLVRGTGWRGLAAMNRPGVRRPFLADAPSGRQAFLGGALSERRPVAAEAPDGRRPFLTDAPVTRERIMHYAAQHQVQWREDPTNQSEDFLRNRLRPQVRALPLETKMRIYDLWKRQREIAQEIDAEVATVLAPLCPPPLLSPRPSSLPPSCPSSLPPSCPSSSSCPLPCPQSSPPSLPRQIFRDLDSATADEILRGWLQQHQIDTTRPQRQNFLSAIREYQPGKYFNLPRDRMAKISKNEISLL